MGPYSSGSPPHPAPGPDYDLFHSTPPHGSIGSRAALTHVPSPARVQNTGSPIHPQSPVLIAPKDPPGCRAALTTPPYPQGPAGRAGGGATPSAELLPPLPLQAGDVGRTQPQGRPKGGPLRTSEPSQPHPLACVGSWRPGPEPGSWGPGGLLPGYSPHWACPLGPQATSPSAPPREAASIAGGAQARPPCPVR